jgi:hypothetical protein
MNETFKTWSIAIAIVTGIIINGYFVGRSLERFKREDRYISVKGFSEREVKANLAVWNIRTRITTNDLIEGSKTIEDNKNKIIEFLQNNGIQKHEIITQNSSVTDKLAREYGPNDIGAFRYIIENSIQVRTENVDTIQYVSRQTDKLLKVGVLITENNEYNPSVKYLFTGLNEIKPAMLSEATQNARNAATEFTKESGVRLGKLKKASQGLFTITDRDYSIQSSMHEGGYSPSVNDLYKKVRVVVNIEYSIE